VIFPARAREESAEKSEANVRKTKPSGFSESSGDLQLDSIAREPHCAEYGGSPDSTGGSSKWRLAMRFRLWKAIVAGIFLMGLMGPGVRAQDGGDEGCRDATLRGDYAFTVSGTIWVTDPSGAMEVVQRNGIAMTHFNGTGGLTQVDNVLSSPNNLPKPPAPPTDPVSGFQTDETGTYKVHSDCTGTFTINTSSSIITVNFVLSDHGRAIHTIVTSLYLLKPSGPVLTPALIHSEGHKLGKIREELD
jgi:hypothetical protein